MVSIRRNIFETNSSSTHSVSICTENQWEDWVAGRALLNRETGEIEAAPKPILQPSDYEEAERHYTSCISKYQMTWKQLSSKLQKEYTENYVKINLIAEKERSDYYSKKYMTFTDWLHRYVDDGLEFYHEVHPVNIDGEKKNVVAYGYYGYR